MALLKVTAASKAADEAAELLPLPLAEVDRGLGAPKKDVMLAFCLGFLGSEPGIEPLALRLMDDMAEVVVVVVVVLTVRRRRNDSDLCAAETGNVDNRRGASRCGL